MAVAGSDPGGESAGESSASGVDVDEGVGDGVGEESPVPGVAGSGGDLGGDAGGEGAVADEVGGLLGAGEGVEGHDDGQLDVDGVGVGDAGGAFDEGAGHDLADGAGVAGRMEAAGPGFEGVVGGEELFGGAADDEGADAVGFGVVGDVLVGAVGCGAGLGGVGVGADDSLAGQGGGAPWGEAVEVVGDLAVDEQGVVGVEGAGLADDGACGGLADHTGAERGAH